MTIHNKTRARKLADYEDAVREAIDILAWAAVTAAQAGTHGNATWSAMHNTAELILREMNE